ncbi:hypothetical protein [Streptomyces sp. NPDC046862]|uniref:hypothetical protein n=1 Tax=Streptomyces sp. NPDC046862 TaxID=3154603 RepID=UPI0034559EFA
MARDPKAEYSEAADSSEYRRLDGDFAGTVTVRPGERFLVANRYSNQPGYTWKVTKEPDGTVVGLRPGPPRTTGAPAADRRPPTAGTGTASPPASPARPRSNSPAATTAGTTAVPRRPRAGSSP